MINYELYFGATLTRNVYPRLSLNGCCCCCCCGNCCCAARHNMVTDIVELFSVAVELSCRRDAIILSLPCSSFELIPLNVATTQELWGSDQVIFKDNRLLTCTCTCTCRLMDWQADHLKSSISLQHRRSYAFLKLFTDPAFTTSAGRLFHTLTTLWLKKCFLV